MIRLSSVVKRRIAVLAVAGVVAAGAYADAPSQEIGYLIDSVGQSGCTFVRNGKSHSAEDAADHLRMKYRRGKSYASGAEQFISRLASKSFLSGKPYFIICDGEDTQKTGDWLTQRLVRYRASRSTGAEQPID